MGAINLTDAFVYCAGHDFTTDTNSATLQNTAEAKDGTTFGVGWNVVVPGLKKATFDMAGFWQSATADAVDPESFPDIGVIDRVFTVGADHDEAPNPAPLTTRERCYIFQGGKVVYDWGGQVGEVTPFTLNSAGSRGVGAKQGLLLKKKANVSATGQLGSAFDTLGFGVPSTGFVYATLHLFLVGTTITVQVQTDDNSGFSSPTTIATLGPLTTRGGTWLTPVAGPITDRYLRFNVSAITGTFSVGAAMAVA